jgi:hypothetical protein
MDLSANALARVDSRIASIDTGDCPLGRNFKTTLQRESCSGWIKHFDAASMHSSRFHEPKESKNFSSVSNNDSAQEEAPGRRAGALWDERQDAISGVVTIRTTKPESTLGLVESSDFQPFVKN